MKARHCNHGGTSVGSGVRGLNAMDPDSNQQVEWVHKMLCNP